MQDLPNLLLLTSPGNMALITTSEAQNLRLKEQQCLRVTLGHGGQVRSGESRDLRVKSFSWGSSWYEWG